MLRWRLVQVWDIVAVLLLFPVVVLMGTQLPGDWKIHNGSSLPGTATVVAVEPLRGGKHILVDVADEAGPAWQLPSGAGGSNTRGRLDAAVRSRHGHRKHRPHTGPTPRVALHRSSWRPCGLHRNRRAQPCHLAHVGLMASSPTCRFAVLTCRE